MPILKAIQLRYRRADKKGEVAILNEFCAVSGYHRKYAIHILNERGKRHKQQRPGRKPVCYSHELLIALKRLWFACLSSQF